LYIIFKVCYQEGYQVGIIQRHYNKQRAVVVVIAW